MLRRSLFACTCAALSTLEIVSAPLAVQPSARRMAPPTVPPAGGGVAVAAPSAPVPAPEEAGAREEAEGRFRRGRRLFLEGAWDAALAEFLESRRLYPTWSATSSAGACLMNLGRFDDALEVLEGLLATYEDALPAAVKTAAQKEVIALRDRVGTIALVKAEPGAAVAIDGRARGEHPAAAPLRVVAGTHVVRIDKEGFEPFETAASVAGGHTTMGADVRVTIDVLMVHAWEMGWFAARSMFVISQVFVSRVQACVRTLRGLCAASFQVEM
ncbi:MULTISPECIES: PEGA domain-containing protein [Sorangium]|uniref:PEGA domain-containing protein n=1 Tax=Sorangium cellulosum TaxID=56 RepID=A0A4P2QNU5_SORCE|nr:MULTISPECIES: PEGA domain-containing protein [Sorangium]AUX31173.1 uncharacterized protein SOCE836_033000 [Sorangium cellulosum]WCQ90555.1 hypothetical protein NQZ70_03266 [Sorangium sp. Soce836]